MAQTEGKAIIAVTSGVGASVIQNGTVKHVLLLELLTEYGAGTLVS